MKQNALNIIKGVKALAAADFKKTTDATEYKQGYLEALDSVERNLKEGLQETQGTVGPAPVIEMSGKEAMEIIRAGLTWANWEGKQLEAMKYAYVAISKTDTYTIALQKIGNASGRLGQLAKFMPQIAREALDTFGEKHRFVDEEEYPNEAIIKEWTHHLGYDKATLIKLGYPHDMVLMMSDEDVTSELEAIQ